MRMRCPEPGAHKPSGEGGWMAPAVFLVAAIFFAMFGWAVNLLLIGVFVAAFVLVAGVAAMLLIRAHRLILGGGQVRYVPQMSAPRPAPPARPAVPPGGQHLHIHLGDLSPAERAAALRQIRGG